MAVVFLYAKDGTTLIALDATTSIERTRSAQMTKSTVQSGATISDHYHSDLPSVSFSGLITESKIRNTTPTVDTFVSLVDALIDAKTPFTLYGTDDGAIPSMDDTLITNCTVVRGIRNLNSLEVSFRCEQLDISKTAKTEAITLPAKTTNGQLASETKAGVGTKTEPTVAYTQAKLREIQANTPPPVTTTPPSGG